MNSGDIYLNIPNLDGIICPIFFKDIDIFMPAKDGITIIFTNSFGIFQTKYPLKKILEAVEDIYKGLSD